MRRSRLIPFCAALAFAGAALADAPRRVVTMNHCADQYALLLAAPGQVVSVSHIALDPFLDCQHAPEDPNRITGRFFDAVKEKYQPTTVMVKVLKRHK